MIHYSSTVLQFSFGFFKYFLALKGYLPKPPFIIVIFILFLRFFFHFRVSFLFSILFKTFYVYGFSISHPAFLNVFLVVTRYLVKSPFIIIIIVVLRFLIFILAILMFVLLKLIKISAECF